MTTVVKPRWDVLVVVTSDQFGSERFGTLRRMIDAALHNGTSVQVWACGYATMLTQRSDAPSEPAGEACCTDACGPSCGCEATGRSASDLIGDLVTSHDDRFSWIACRTCSDDRGAGEHVPGVLTDPSFADFRQYVDDAAKVIYIGGD